MKALPQAHPAHAQAYPRTIKSFVTRAGRLTAAQERAFSRFGAEFLIPFKEELLGGITAFNPKEPIVLEIGFGMGEATAHIASIRPSDNFLCCEVHTPGVGALLKRVGEQGLKNIRIIQHDAVEVLEHMLMDSFLDGIHIFFPDPWHKARHNKRRLIQTPFMAKLTSKLKVGGYIHAATDWQNYAEQILEVMHIQPQLENTATCADGYVIRPAYRPLTKFENRGIKLGHGVWDVVFKKCAEKKPHSPA